MHQHYYTLGAKVVRVNKLVLYGEPRESCITKVVFLRSLARCGRIITELHHFYTSQSPVGRASIIRRERERESHRFWSARATAPSSDKRRTSAEREPNFPTFSRSTSIYTFIAITHCNRIPLVMNRDVDTISHFPAFVLAILARAPSRSPTFIVT